MRILIFCHSLVSDWNHGNAHFLRGITAELMRRGHDVRVYEPVESWSRCNLEADYGQWPIVQFHRRYPCLESTRYDDAIDLDAVLQDADLVLVHEWNEPDLVARIGRHRAEHDHYRLLFHDTHHRSVTAPDAMAAFGIPSVGSYGLTEFPIASSAEPEDPLDVGFIDRRIGAEGLHRHTTSGATEVMRNWRRKKMISSTMMGEMSMPPRSGRILRTGRSTGSVIRNRKSPIMPTNWLREFTTLNA